MPPPQSPLAWRTIGAVFLGGVLGTAARAGLGLLIPVEPGSGAVGAVADPALMLTLAINLAGTLLLGITSGASWPARLDWLRAGVGTGFLGAFTTFSLVALAFAVLGFDAPWAWGLLVLGVLGGLLLAAVGHQLGAAIGRGAREEEAR